MDRKKKRAKLIGKRQLRRNASRAASHFLQNAKCNENEHLAHNILPNNCNPTLTSEHVPINSHLVKDNFGFQENVGLPNNEVSLESDDGSSDNFSLPSSSDSAGTTFEDVPLKDKLHVWSLQNKITLKALSELLDILSAHHPELPLDARTLLNTPRTTEVIELQNGSYSHVGLRKGILSRMAHGLNNDNSEQHISVDINIDGIPLYKSVSQDCWPILGRSQSLYDDRPFVIGLFCGSGKPEPINTYLSSFIKDVEDIQEHGIKYNGKEYKCYVRYYLCDAPARAYLKQIIGHNGRAGCERCIQEGVYIDHCMTFLKLDSTLRTDENFEEHRFSDHHRGLSPLQALGTKFITQFPLDPMHLVYLGVVRRLILSWGHKGKHTSRLRARDLLAMSEKLTMLRKYVPSDFSRKCRTLKEVKRWKATEFRLFILYVGPLVLKDVLSSERYDHFMLLHCALTILTNKEMCVRLLEYAKGLIRVFVEHCKFLYGSTFLVYNVHSLMHICDDVQKYGPLEKFSCFPFENALGGIKKMVRTPSNPLQQLVRRIAESELNVQDLARPAAVLKHPHDNGPTFPGRETCSQFYKIVLPGGCTIETKSPNNCCQMKNNTICVIENILSYESGDVEFVVKEFAQHKDFYSYPCASNKLGSVIVSSLTGIKVYMKDFLRCKCVLLPLKNSEWVAIPLIHTV